jgi:hypothetical protein
MITKKKVKDQQAKSKVWHHRRLAEKSINLTLLTLLGLDKKIGRN